jgi:hypothetical protein
MPDLDAELAANLKAAKSSTMFFAVIAKGTSDGALLLSRSAVPANRIAEAKKNCGGNTLFKGRCYGEDGTLIFEMANEPPTTLAAQIRGLAQRTAGISLTVATRCKSDLQDDPAAAPQPENASPQPASGAAPEDLTAAYTARLKAAGTALTQAMKAGAPIADLKTLFSQAMALVTKKAFAEAEGPLAQLETKLKSGVSAAPSEPPAPKPSASAPPESPASKPGTAPSEPVPAKPEASAPDRVAPKPEAVAPESSSPKPEATELTNRLKTLAPKYLQATRSADPESRKTLENLFTQARTQMSKNDFAAATASVSNLEALVAKAAP